MTPAEQDIIIAACVFQACHYARMTRYRAMNAASMALGWGSKPLVYAPKEGRAVPGQWSGWLHLPGDFPVTRN